MKPTLLLPVWVILTFFFTGCSMSRTQCAKGTRTIMVSNFLIDEYHKGDSIVKVSWPGHSIQLERDNSVEITQFADKDRSVPAIDVGVEWRRGVKRFSFGQLTLDTHFFGPQENLDLFPSPDHKELLSAPY